MMRLNDITFEEFAFVFIKALIDANILLLAEPIFHLIIRSVLKKD